MDAISSLKRNRPPVSGGKLYRWNPSGKLSPPPRLLYRMLVILSFHLACFCSSWTLGPAIPDPQSPLLLSAAVAVASSVSFADIAGADAAKVELAELVDFLGEGAERYAEADGGGRLSAARH